MTQVMKYKIKKVIGILLIFLLLISVTGVMFLSVWKKNKYSTLLRSRITLEKEVSQLENKIIMADLNLNELNKRIYLEKMGIEKFGLTYNTNSYKLRVRKEND